MFLSHSNISVLGTPLRGSAARATRATLDRYPVDGNPARLGLSYCLHSARSSIAQPGVLLVVRVSAQFGVFTCRLNADLDPVDSTADVPMDDCPRHGYIPQGRLTLND